MSDSTSAGPSRRLAALALATLLSLPAGILLAASDADADSASSVATIPTPVFHDTSAVWDGATNAYIFGPGTQIFRYAPGTNTVTTMGTVLPIAVVNTSAVWDGAGNAYIIGGSNGGVSSNQITRYTPGTGTAVPTGHSLSPARHGTSAVWDGTANAYIFGGVQGFGAGAPIQLSAILRYTPSTGALTVVASLPTARSGTAAVWDGAGNAYVFGGHDGTSPLTEVVRFTPATNTVTVVGNLPQGRAAMSATWDGQNAYLFGGHGSGPTASVVRFTPSTGAATTMAAALPSARTETSAVMPSGGRAYVLSGVPTWTEVVRYSLEPGAPLSPAAAPGPGAGQVRVTWQPPASNTYSANTFPLTVHRVHRSATPGGTYVEVGVVAASTLTFTESGQGNNAQRCYKVRSENAVGQGPFSAPVCATTFSVPCAPNPLTATAGPSAGQVSLAWTAPCTGGAGVTIDHYNVERRPGAGSYSGTTATTAATSHLDAGPGLGNGATWCYRVSATSSVGLTGPFSTEACATTFDLPCAPPGLTATAGGGAGQITLAWGVPSCTGGSPIDHYNVYRSGSASGPFSPPELAQAAGTTHVDSGLGNGVTWCYAVSAVNVGGLEGPLSASSCATTFTPASAPLNLVAVTGVLPAEVRLDWDAPTNIGGPAPLSYRLYWGTQSGVYPNSVVVPAPSGPGHVTYNHTVLPPATTPIYYHVTAINGAGLEGPASNEACATPMGSVVLLAEPCPMHPSFTERTLVDQPVPVGGGGASTPPIDEDVLRVKGGQNAADPLSYDLDVAVGGNALPTVTFFTNGLLATPVDVSLLHVPAIPVEVPGTTTRLIVKERHDAAYHQCLLAVGGICHVDAPASPGNPAWALTQGVYAQLIVQVVVEDEDGNVLARQTVTVLYLGQVAWKAA